MEENEVKDNVQITEDAIAVIVRMAVKEVDGVSKIALGLGGGISEALGKQNVGKGVKAEITDGNVKINVDIIIQYGAKIPEVAARLQEKIRTDVESMTGLKVTDVSLKIQGIETADKNEKDNEQDIELKPEAENNEE